MVETGDPSAAQSPCPGEHQRYIVDEGSAGQRLDRFLTLQLQAYSRSAITRMIIAGHALVEGKACKAGYRLHSGERIDVTPPAPERSDLVPEPIDFTVLHEDEHLLVIAKPPGLVVHPAAGHRHGTLAHGLLHHCRELPGIEEARPGIVHRLDRDTSGIMLAAKSERARNALMAAFKNRSIGKTYLAILAGCPPSGSGRIVAPLGRHPVNRKKMAIRQDSGKYAATRWNILESYAAGCCLVELDLETGRTHQIRVHMASMGTPVLGDRLYGGVRQGVCSCSRQMLHASALEFLHPVSGQVMRFSAPLYADMEELLRRLRDYGT